MYKEYTAASAGLTVLEQTHLHPSPWFLQTITATQNMLFDTKRNEHYPRKFKCYRDRYSST